MLLIKVHFLLFNVKYVVISHVSTKQNATEEEKSLLPSV